MSVALDSPSEAGTRVVLTLSGAASQNVFTLSDPDRLVIDLSATRLASGVRMPAPAGPVKSLRSGIQPKQTLRLVLELTLESCGQYSGCCKWWSAAGDRAGKCRASRAGCADAGARRACTCGDRS
jgi:hypothetical protein